jgi:hypothetical protein
MSLGCLFSRRLRESIGGVPFRRCWKPVSHRIVGRSTPIAFTTFRPNPESDANSNHFPFTFVVQRCQEKKTLCQKLKIRPDLGADCRSCYIRRDLLNTSLCESKALTLTVNLGRESITTLRDQKRRSIIP